MVPENQRNNPWMKKPCRMLSVQYSSKCPSYPSLRKHKKIFAQSGGNVACILTSVERVFTWLWAAAWIQWILCFYNIWVFHAKTGKLITLLFRNYPWVKLDDRWGVLQWLNHCLLFCKGTRKTKATLLIHNPPIRKLMYILMQKKIILWCVYHLPVLKDINPQMCHFYGIMTTHSDQEVSKWLKAICGRNVKQ